MQHPLPPIDIIKVDANTLRRAQDALGQPISHSRSLEMIAHKYGYKDWNTLVAASRKFRPVSRLAVNQKVHGSYLGQNFTGRLLSLKHNRKTDRFRAQFQFDEPVDVVRFQSFSALRHRVSCWLTPAGVTEEKTSNGEPHLRLSFNTGTA